MKEKVASLIPIPLFINQLTVFDFIIVIIYYYAIGNSQIFSVKSNNIWWLICYYTNCKTEIFQNFAFESLAVIHQVYIWSSTRTHNSVSVPYILVLRNTYKT